jgi:hypothetical protein
MGELYIPFVRIERFEPTTIALIKVATEGNMTRDEVVNAIIKMVTRWVDETKDGADVWKESCEDLNIGDLFLHEKEFRDWMYESDYPFELGILHIEFIVCEDADGGEPFDLVLVDKRLEEKMAGV